jgi:hypothetical protein
VAWSRTEQRQQVATTGGKVVVRGGAAATAAAVAVGGRCRKGQKLQSSDSEPEAESGSKTDESGEFEVDNAEKVEERGAASEVVEADMSNNAVHWQERVA